MIVRVPTIRNSRRRLIRDLIESVYETPKSPLKVDREQGIIYGVKVLGRYSQNNHGLREAVNGSEYTPECMREALPLYEGCKVKRNHLKDRTNPDAERDTDDTLGKLRNVRIESDQDGNDAIRGDLHYLKSHPMADRLVEDVERGLGVYGFSHNAKGRRESFDPKGKRLVIESLEKVRSVDLVDRPATGTNLWESQTVTKTMKCRELLESQMTHFLKKPKRLARLNALLEDDMMAMPLDVESEVDDAGSPEDKITGGFYDMICSIVDQALRGDMEKDEAHKKVKDLFKSHSALTDKEEPKDVEESADKPKEEKSENPNKLSDDDKNESIKIKAENERLKREAAARELCESMDIQKPSKSLIKSVSLLDTEAERRELLEAMRPSGIRVIRSAGVGHGPKQGKPASGSGGRDVQESEDHEQLANRLRHGAGNN